MFKILIFSFSLISMMAKSQCKNYYWNDNGELRFGKKLIKTKNNDYLIHPNSAYLTRWDDQFLDLWEWQISFCGFWIFHPFKDLKYDPVKSHFRMTGQYHGQDDKSIFLRIIDDVGHPHGPASYEIKFIELIEADRASFKELSEDARYGKDANRVFFNFWTITDADPNTFEVLSGKFETKKSEIRSGKQKLYFEVSGGIARDKNHVYWNHAIMKNISPQDFELIDVDQCKWKDNRYRIEQGGRLTLIQENK
jgi:hypothetical protein